MIKRLILLILFSFSAITPTLSAETFPTRPITMIVPFPPGGSTDTLGRLMAQKMTDILGQPVVVENRAGAAGNIGLNEAVKAAPDGYTIVIAGGANAINVTLYDNLPFNFATDVTPLGLIGIVQNIMMVHPDFPAQTPSDFIDLAQANPGKLSYASSGNGATTHLAGELFKSVTDVQMTHIPYKGSAPALSDLLGQHVDVMFDSFVSSVGFAKSGRLRALAVTGPERSLSLPDIPTLQELGIDVDAVSFFGVFAPASVPHPIAERYNSAIREIVQMPEITSKLQEMGVDSQDMDQETFAAFTQSEIDKWASVVRSSGAKAE